MSANNIDDLIAHRALAEYGLAADSDVRMINLSENATFIINDSANQREGVLRVHREGYHPTASIESELLWLDALREDGGVATPKVIPATDGRRVVTITHDGRDRDVVLFEMIGGIEPDEEALGTKDFHVLGGITARLHVHARHWRLPDGFTRFAWDWQHTLGGEPRWGRWQDGIGVGSRERSLLAPAVDLIHRRLEAYGTGSERFGLVHADLRLANLLVDGDVTNVIDFDDCGFSWFLYDFGAAVSFIEHDPRLGEWQAAWLSGYREVAELSQDDEDMLATFVMLRRFMLVAWMGSHAHSREVQTKGPAYATGTCDLAERYLSSGGRLL